MGLPGLANILASSSLEAQRSLLSDLQKLAGGCGP
jgi:hypothetical protein